MAHQRAGVFEGIGLDIDDAGRKPGLQHGITQLPDQRTARGDQQHIDGFGIAG